MATLWPAEPSLSLVRLSHEQPLVCLSAIQPQPLATPQDVLLACWPAAEPPGVHHSCSGRVQARLDDGV